MHSIGAIASGLFGASAYYLADYGAGIMVLIIKSELTDRVPKNDFARISHVFPQVMILFELCYRPAFIHYLTQKGYAVTKTADSVSAILNPDTLTATFDDLGRLANLKGSS